MSEQVLTPWQQYRQAMFSHFAQEHGLTLLESEMNDVEQLVFSGPDFTALREELERLKKENAQLHAIQAEARSDALAFSGFD